MLNQRSYPNIKLGFSDTLTIASHGCFSICILQGLLDRDYTFSVSQWNDLLKSSGVYTQANPTLISAPDLAIKLPKIFSESRKEAWNDTNLINYLSQRDYIVIGEVSGKGIGGSGQHFVLVRQVGVDNGKVTMTYIDDPWGGLSSQKVTTRYGAYGNILSLRIFRVKKVIIDNNGGLNMTYEQFYQKFIEAYRKHKSDIEWGDDKNKPESTILDDVACLGRMFDAIANDKKSKEQRIKDLETALAKTENMVVNAVEIQKTASDKLCAYQLEQKDIEKAKALENQKVVLEKQCDYKVEKLNATITALTKKVTELENKPTSNNESDNQNWVLNGKTETIVKDGVTTTLNYARRPS